MRYSYNISSKEVNGELQYSVNLVKAPTYSTVIESVYDKICAVSKGVLGGHDDRLWRIPLGKPKYDPEDGMLNNSLGECLSSIEAKVNLWAWDKEQEVLSIPITKSQYTLLSKAYK